MDWYPIVIGTIASTITMATPLLLAALGETVVQKSGVVNVGLEGIMLFGAKRVGRGLHFTATVLVAGGTLFSAFWILSANSWMQTPAG